MCRGLLPRNSFRKDSLPMKKIKRTNHHHRRSRLRTQGHPFNGNIEGVPNVIVVDHKKHCAFHCLFTDNHPVAIAKELTETWIDPAYILVAIPKEDARKVLKHLAQFTWKSWPLSSSLCSLFSQPHAKMTPHNGGKPDFHYLLTNPPRMPEHMEVWAGNFGRHDKTLVRRIYSIYGFDKAFDLIEAIRRNTVPPY